MKRRYPETLGATDDRARLAATFAAGPICTFSSHPPDTIKTCLQGDIEGRAYVSYSQAARKIVLERGAAALWAGLPWRVFRQFCCVFIFDKINSDVPAILFPSAYKRPASEPQAISSY